MAYERSVPFTNGGSAQITRRYLRNWKRTITTCGKIARRKNCEKVLKNIPGGKRSVGEPRKR